MAGAYVEHASRPGSSRAAPVVPGYEHLFVPLRWESLGGGQRVCHSPTHWPGPLGHLAMQPRSIGMLVPVMPGGVRGQEQHQFGHILGLQPGRRQRVVASDAAGESSADLAVQVGRNT